MRRIALMVFRLFFKAFYYFYHICKCASRDDISYEEGFRWIKRTTILANRAGRVKIDAHGIENLPEKDGFIMFPNHQGLFDVLVFLESCPRPFAFVIKKEAANKINVQIQLLADELGLSDSMKKFPYQVSGGQRQRCAFARAVINRPDLIMADEPTGALDSISANILLNKMLKFNEELHTTIFMVTHDAFSASFSKRILFLKDGKIFCEIFKKEKSQSIFYSEILHVLSNMGDVSYVE